MRSLLNKELRLAASPLTFLFLLFAAMALIPNYPILVGVFFMCLGIFYSFQRAREANDILYTVLLPIEKGDAVKAKYLFTCLVELIGLALIAALTAVRMTALRGVTVYAENAMMNANLVYLAWAALVFALFNTAFLGLFFRTAYKFGGPFVTFSVLSFFLIVIAEVLHHIPGLGFLNGTDRLDLQAAILAAALCIYAAATAISYRRARRRFERLDL